MKAYKIPLQEAAEIGFNWKIVLDSDDLTETTANTAQTIELIDVEVGSIVRDCAAYLKTPFEDASDTAFNVTTVIIGDGDDDNRYLTSTELNENGTEIDAKIETHATNSLPYAYTSADTIDAVFGGMSGKSLSNVDTGELHVFLNVVNLADH